VKLHTPEKSVLIDISAIKPDPAGLLIEGKIMNAMPMKAVLTAAEARQGLKLLSGPVLWRVLTMLIRGKAK
jgi:hypothetical protein